MSNLINANSNQDYFQFHGSHSKYEKGAPLGLPTSKSIFKKFLQNLEGTFIKGSSKSKALLYYPTGCPRRHCTPDLFISSYLHCMEPADPCGKPSWSSQSFMHHHILCDLFHGIHGVPRDAGISNDNSRCKVGAQAVIRCAQAGHHGSDKGEVAQPLPIH